MRRPDIAGGGCAFARVQPTEAADALGALDTGWTEGGVLGPRPAIWFPGASAWAELLNERRRARGAPAAVSAGASFARTPIVIAVVHVGEWAASRDARTQQLATR